MSGCVIFDFDGVIADTELLHLQAYNHTFEQHAKDVGSIKVSPDEYFSHYVVYGDREALGAMLEAAGVAADQGLLEKLVRTKQDIFRKHLGDFAEPLPGVRELLAWLEQRKVPRAICSGAGRHEIETLLKAFRLGHYFEEIVAIEDVTYGKPDPQGYLLAFARLAARHSGLKKERALVIEDSAGGCKAARAAAIRVLGVATSMPLHEVAKCADAAIKDLAEIDHEQLAAWLGL